MSSGAYDYDCDDVEAALKAGTDIGRETMRIIADRKRLAVAVEALREIAARPHAEWCPRYVSDLEACNCLANLEASAVATAALAKIEGDKP